jgi:tetratricopeptide (TPR) repeat protein
VDELQKCLQVWPRSGETYFTLARTYRRMGDQPKARMNLQKAKTLNWSTAAIDLEYKLIQAQSNAVRQVDQLLKSYLNAGHQDDMIIMEALVEGYRQLNFLNDAYHWATVWAERYPSMWQPWLVRGMILEAGQRMQLAAADFETALQIKPDQPEARYFLAGIYLRVKEYPVALQHYEYYQKLRPDDVRTKIGMAACLRALNRSEEARKLLDEVLATNLQHSGAFTQRGLLYLDEDRPKDALVWLRKAVELTPMELDIVQNFIVALRGAGQMDEAAEMEKRRLQIEADLKRMEAIIKELPDAETASKEEDDTKREKHFQMRFEAGTILQRLGRLEQSKGWYLSVLQEDPGHPASLKALSDIHRKMNEAEVARYGRDRPGNSSRPPAP